MCILSMVVLHTSDKIVNPFAIFHVHFLTWHHTKYICSAQSKNLRNLEIVYNYPMCAISITQAPVCPTASDLLCSSQDGRHP